MPAKWLSWLYDLDFAAAAREAAEAIETLQAACWVYVRAGRTWVSLDVVPPGGIPSPHSVPVRAFDPGASADEIALAALLVLEERHAPEPACDLSLEEVRQRTALERPNALTRGPVNAGASPSLFNNPQSRNKRRSPTR